MRRPDAAQPKAIIDSSATPTPIGERRWRCWHSNWQNLPDITASHLMAPFWSDPGGKILPGSLTWGRGLRRGAASEGRWCFARACSIPPSLPCWQQQQQSGGYGEFLSCLCVQADKRKHGTDLIKHSTRTSPTWRWLYKLFESFQVQAAGESSLVFVMQSLAVWNIV
jgi:hypothetical protein